jgi:rhodanese-related sulfurtransferase
MPKRKYSRRSSRRSQYTRSQPKVGTYLRRPIVQIGILVVVGLLVFLIASLGNEQAGNAGNLPASISVDKAYQMYQEGTFVLDVRTQEEWNDYHVPNTTLIPLDELESRLNDLPKDQPIVVVCRSGNRSQTGRDILLQAGFNATSMEGGLKNWSAQGYPIDGTRP